MPDLFSNFVSNLEVTAVQVDIIGHQRHSSAYGGHTGCGVNLGGAKIGFPFCLFDFFNHTLILAFANVGQILSFRAAGRFFIQINGKRIFLGCLFCDFFGKDDSFFHIDVFNRNKWNHVDSPHPRVLALVGSHIDDLDSTAHRRNDGCFEGIRFSDHRNHHPIVIFICLIVEKLNTVFFPKGRHNFFDVFRISSLTEIGHAFDYFFHSSHIFLLNLLLWHRRAAALAAFAALFYRRAAEFAERIIFLILRMLWLPGLPPFYHRRYRVS